MSIPHAMTKENSHNHGQDPPKEFFVRNHVFKEPTESIELHNQLLTIFKAVSYYKNKQL